MLLNWRGNLMLAINKKIRAKCQKCIHPILWLLPDIPIPSPLGLFMHLPVQLHCPFSKGPFPLHCFNGLRAFPPALTHVPQTVLLACRHGPLSMVPLSRVCASASGEGPRAKNLRAALTQANSGWARRQRSAERPTGHSSVGLPPAPSIIQIPGTERAPNK